MKKIAIVYIAHDGFTSLYTGVGTVARDFLLSFPEVSRKLKKEYKDIQLDLFATTIKYSKECFGYSEEIKGNTERLTKLYKNIHLVELINGSAGTKSYGSIDVWKNACISAATFLYSLTVLEKYDSILAVCVDTPFAQVPNYFFDQYNVDFIDFVWLPQSTVLIHKIDSAIGISSAEENYIKERYEWEKAVIDQSKTNNKVKIGSVGTFMQKHLLEAYKADKTTLVNLQNGLYFKRLSAYKKTQEEIHNLLAKLNIPTDRPLLYSFGRAESYKGLDLVLKNSIELIKKKNFFVFILASPYSMEDDYVVKLKKLAENYPLDIKIIFGLDFLTPHYIMQWKNTKILALLSRAEPFGLIPVESRFYNNKNLSLLTTKADGFLYQIDQGTDGFMVNLEDSSIKSILLKISNLSKKEKGRLATNGHRRVMKDYNQININFNFLHTYIKKYIQ